MTNPSSNLLHVAGKCLQG